jgi:hypothetical protein
LFSQYTINQPSSHLHFSELDKRSIRQRERGLERDYSLPPKSPGTGHKSSLWPRHTTRAHRYRLCFWPLDILSRDEIAWRSLVRHAATAVSANSISVRCRIDWSYRGSHGLLSNQFCTKSATVTLLWRSTIRSSSHRTVSVSQTTATPGVLQIWHKGESWPLHAWYSILPTAEALYKSGYVSVGRGLFAVEHIYSGEQAGAAKRMAGLLCAYAVRYTVESILITNVVVLVYPRWIFAMGDRKRAPKSNHSPAQRDRNGGDNRHAGVSPQSIWILSQQGAAN